MVVSSTLVNVSDDAEVRLVSLLAEAAPSNVLSPSFQADCQKSIDAGEAGPLLTTILNDAGAMAALLTLELEEAVAAFSLLAALLERASGRTAQELVNGIVNIQIPDKEERKITLLATLYNMRSDRNEKVDLLRQMIELAGLDPLKSLLAPGQTLGRLLSCEGDEEFTISKASGRCLDHSQPPLVSLLDSWQVQDRRALYTTIASILPVSDIRKQRFLLLLVASCTAADGRSDQVSDVAVEAAVGAIRDPVSLFVHQRNMMSWPAIQALSTKHPVLFGLLQVFQEGKLSDYNSFLQSNGGADAVLKSLALDVDSCTRNMRILSLCSIAADHEEIPYSTIAETLQLPSDSEVETWVIAAVSSGLLQAKMDQLQQKVMVERSVVRRFGIEQWKVLQGRLRMWKQNVGGVLSALKESQEGSASLKPNN